jgi:poly(ADP-ribose) glycohydrolase ARH3
MGARVIDALGSSPDVTALDRERCRGALVGLVLGDALGAEFEGHAGPVPDDLLDGHLRDPSPQHFTDDTAMAIGLCESLLELGNLDEDHLIGTFLAHYRAEPWRGYGPGAIDLFERLHGGEAWREAAPRQFGGRGSFGNGAAMRVAPLAVQAGGDPELSAQLARRSAVVTHTHPFGVEGAALQAAAVAHALSGAEVRPVSLLMRLGPLIRSPELVAALEAVVALGPSAEPAQVARSVGSGVAAHESVPAALAAAGFTTSFEDAVRFAIAMGGDTDTVASMAAAVAGAAHGRSAIPAEWVERSEGARHMEQLADRLVDAGTGPDRR